MTTERTFVDKNGNFWSWNEDENVLKALKELHNIQNENKTNEKTKTVV